VKRSYSDYLEIKNMDVAQFLKDNSLKNIAKSIKHSTKVVSEMAKQFDDFKLFDPNFSMIICGSYARREATLSSDLDYFFIADDNKTKENIKKNTNYFSTKVSINGVRGPSEGGAFNQIETIDEFINHIGGNSDSNEKFTRRILCLMEGDSIFRKDKHREYVKKIISVYITENTSSHGMATFLLNDLIRYYRTVFVDFEYKTNSAGKAWGIRNIKLLFPRKLMYFSGILVCALTIQRRWEEKREIPEEYLRLSPVERIVRICGTDCLSALSYYDSYLSRMNAEEFREMLEKTSQDRETHSLEFYRIRNDSFHFSMELLNLLRKRFHDTHPIHRYLTI